MSKMTLEQAMTRFPPMWTIYDHPKDYPCGFIARLWYGETPTDQCLHAPDIVQIRELVVEAGGSMPLVRDSGDDPCIVETWV